MLNFWQFQHFKFNENEKMIVAVNAIYAIAQRSLKKFRTSTEFELLTLRLQVQCSTNWAMKPLTLGAGQLLWVHMFPWKKWVLMIYEINHVWNAEMKWKWRNEVLNFFQASLGNSINCVHCDDHFFIFMSLLQFMYDLFHISLTFQV